MWVWLLVGLSWLAMLTLIVLILKKEFERGPVHLTAGHEGDHSHTRSRVVRTVASDGSFKPVIIEVEPSGEVRRS